jgi:hypothetical protein
MKANKSRIARLEKNAPKHAPKENPYSAMSDAQLLEKVKNLVENYGVPRTQEDIDLCRQAENILTNNGIMLTVQNESK